MGTEIDTEVDDFNVVRVAFGKGENSDGTRAKYCSGIARCLNCKHEWAAVVPYDVRLGTAIDCPQCSHAKGILPYYYGLPADEEIWECDCGNTLFEVVRDRGVHCPNCGNWMRPE